MDAIYRALEQMSNEYGLPGLTSKVTLPLLVRFLRLASAVKRYALHSVFPPDCTSDKVAIPEAEDLTPSTVAYLALQMEMSQPEVLALWSALGPLVWQTDSIRWLGDDPEWGRTSPLSPGGLGFRMLYPPVRVCDRTYCTDRQLLRQRVDAFHDVALFTLDQGVCDAHAVNLLCPGCGTVYKLNYTVHAKQRIYYAGIPDIIQVAEHTFVERRVLELFTTLSLLSWTSHTNSAHIYDRALSGLDAKTRRIARYHLRTEHVSDGFVILALLKDARDRQYVLHVPQEGDQSVRFSAAMKARNDHMRASGQPEFLHCCDKCVRQYKKPDGSTGFVDAVITDGIEIGRPCCKVRHCTEALSSTQDHYCPSHKSRNTLCYIEACNEQRVGNFRTCDLPSHRAVEEYAALQNKALFTLRRRLQRANTGSQPEDSTQVEPHEDGTVEVQVEETVDGAGRIRVDVDEGPPAAAGAGLNLADAHAAPAEPATSSGAAHANVADEHGTHATTVPCPEKPAVPKRTLRAMFGRRRTHNEQLIVRPCGVIIRRETFYGSESVRQVCSLYKQTWPDPALRPRVSLYDNNCRLYIWCAANGETLHKEIGLPVDVFHWKCKHKKTDEACSIHCNPYAFPEIRNADDTWFFNSSIAEQTNVWLGGYHAIIREMSADKYDFFLDEMIKLKNELTVAKLARQNHVPYYRY
ncbi:uncharacterized protein TRAVEDRAFT_174254 [Trametes versicolor FP-101664 SS1]|uniref:uncharacterized protein n=1 Tax=Trametes versicolor (strain FP-101664) TaxID=717944 RepID=UPI000462486C|nr:uncharacterized protein TRAVEDRAFT_174254 [Trametes versicolor FP-101664 SS1]EIW53439.1 hypothetical protein TRAVEDRAFT_174254 [Trametes versicolor FP-101664 SS1]